MCLSFEGNRSISGRVMRNSKVSSTEVLLERALIVPMACRLGYAFPPVTFENTNLVDQIKMSIDRLPENEMVKEHLLKEADRLHVGGGPARAAEIIHESLVSKNKVLFKQEASFSSGGAAM